MRTHTHTQILREKDGKVKIYLRFDVLLLEYCYFTQFFFHQTTTAFNICQDNICDVLIYMNVSHETFSMRDVLTFQTISPYKAANGMAGATGK